MNELEKRSFYSFSGLYLVSSFLLIALVGYWYYISQRQAFESKTYYKLEHVVDKEASRIISAQMEGTAYQFMPPMEEIDVTLLNKQGIRISGTQLTHMQDHPFCLAMRMKRDTQSTTTLEHYPLGYYNKNGYSILISDAAKGHMGVARIIATTRMLSTSIAALQKEVWQVVLLVMLIVAVIAWLLSKLFMKPVRKRVAQIEDFINDVTHELNTPITSLSMATEQALSTGECSTKNLNNISISTKQLYDIYRSLTYLNFAPAKEPTEVIAVGEVLQKSITYYQPLAQIKRITFETEIGEYRFMISSQQLSLLFGNLIGNAIKYSPAGSVIRLSLIEGAVMIRDQGIGIASEQQQEIYEKFTRATTQSGGFGIGLSIVRSICDQYGIKLTLNSAPEQGTTFRLQFKID
jgi:two-component system OmpR family sensor kinase